MAEIKPFPLARRCAFIRRHAARMAASSSSTAEKHLAYQLQVQAETMVRRGIAQDLVKAQIRSLELAIRAELWRLVMQPGDFA